MGKGDKKTKKGKIRKGSFGVTRPKTKKSPYVASDSEKPKKEKKS